MHCKFSYKYYKSFKNFLGDIQFLFQDVHCIKWHAKYVSTKRKKQMQIMKHKWKLDSGIRGPEKTEVIKN